MLSKKAHAELTRYGWAGTGVAGEYLHTKATGQRIVIALVHVDRFGGRSMVEWAHQGEDGSVTGQGIVSLSYHLMRVNQRLGIGDFERGYTVAQDRPKPDTRIECGACHAFIAPLPVCPKCGCDPFEIHAS